MNKLARSARKYARGIAEKEEEQNGKKAKKWQRRGVFALVSQRDRSDVLGSYTGVPADEEDDRPVQDADDL